MTYEESLAWIAGLQGRGWRLGLDRMRAFVRAAGLEDVLGGPDSPIQYLHVAGTNGKGSVTAYLQSMLVAQGFRTGGYFSPYVVDPRERIQINGELIAKEEFAIVAAELREVAEHFDRTEDGGITEFEFKTAMGFLAWKRAGVEVVALEVGLGGRLDATNVVTSKACAIVSISLDHTSILGNTEAEIAREKAGILKPGVIGVLGEMSKEAEVAIKEIARGVKAPLWRMDREIKRHTHLDEYTVRVPGEADAVEFKRTDRAPHQEGNMAVAIATLVAGGYRKDRYNAWSLDDPPIPGRVQHIQVAGKGMIVDGAHNPAAAARLAESLAHYDPSKTWVAIVGMLEGHDPREFFSERGLGLSTEGWQVAGTPSRPTIKKVNGAGVKRVVAVPVDNPRALPSQTVAAAARAEGFTAESADTLKAALDAIEDDAILVTGSFYLVGEVLRLPGVVTAKPRSKKPR